MLPIGSWNLEQQDRGAIISLNCFQVKHHIWLSWYWQHKIIMQSNCTMSFWRDTPAKNHVTETSLEHVKWKIMIYSSANEWFCLLLSERSQWIMDQKSQPNMPRYHKLRAARIHNLWTHPPPPPPYVPCHSPQQRIAASPPQSIIDSHWRGPLTEPLLLGLNENRIASIDPIRRHWTGGSAKCRGVIRG